MNTDVVIVGGGIAGLTIALASAARGLTVTIVDIPSNGSASRAAAGMLAPSLEGLPLHVLPCALAARDMYPDFLASLHERAGLSVELNRRGILELADREDELERLLARAHPGASLVSPRELGSLEPALAPHAGALHHPLDGAVDNIALMAALERAANTDARISRINERAAAMMHHSAVVTTSGTTVAGSWVVIAGGSWVNELAGLPRRLPVRPVRGQLLSLSCRPLLHVMYAPRTGYLVPRGDTLVVGATTEDADFVNETTPWGRQELLSVVARTLPALSKPSVADHWAGLRPMTPDTLPVLGADPLAPRVVYAAGFSRNGILFAPWAAIQIAELLATERPPASLDSFDVSRFDRDNLLTR